MKKLFLGAGLILMIAVIFSFTQTSSSNKSSLEKLSGTYEDPAPYAYGQAWGKRIFTFDKGRWTLKFTLGLDPELKMQVFTFRTAGTYQVLEKSSVVEGSYNAIFYEEKKFVTVKTADEKLVQAFGFSACNLVKDVEKDISATGCSAWLSVPECPADHDLLSLDKDGKLYFGERPDDNNMCSPERRPKKLAPPVIKK